MCRAANFEQELGVIAACQAVGLQFNSTVSQASVPFFGNQSNSPRSGSPPQVLRHCFPDWCPPGKDIVTQCTGHKQVIPSYRMHKLRGKIPQMARGLQRYTLLYFLRTPGVGGEVQILQSVLGLPAHDLILVPDNLSFFYLCGVAKTHFCPIDTAKMVYAPCSTGLAANFLLRKPNRRSADLLGCRNR